MKEIKRMKRKEGRHQNPLSDALATSHKLDGHEIIVVILGGGGSPRPQAPRKLMRRIQ